MCIALVSCVGAVAVAPESVALPGTLAGRLAGGAPRARGRSRPRPARTSAAAAGARTRPETLAGFRRRLAARIEASDLTRALWERHAALGGINRLRFRLLLLGARPRPRELLTLDEFCHGSLLSAEERAWAAARLEARGEARQPVGDAPDDPTGQLETP
jgi:hypothetical protein